jgi:tetratricopeptide (TPR) repeat protein
MRRNAVLIGMSSAASHPVPELAAAGLPAAPRQEPRPRGTLARMLARPLIGRDAELQQLTRIIGAARAGRGSLWFLSGEPGIGKSRLAEELSERAADEGLWVVWGRCWEAGGAPAYWPWIQILRALLRGQDMERLRQGLGPRARYLAHLMPELAARGAASSELSPLDAERGRFELLDAVSGALCELPRPEGALIILEDLHAADASSLGVFDVLGPQLRSSNVCVLGTFRDADARLSRARDALAAAIQQGRVLALSRLDRAEVGQFLTVCSAKSSSGHLPSDAAGDAVFAATEGNPLFLSEVTRLLTDHGQWEQVATAGVSIPGDLRHTLRRRLDTLSAPTRDALEVAAVLGRDFSGTLLAALWERSMTEAAVPVHEALESGVLLEPAPGEYRFSHVLLREVLHRDIDDARRTELHLEAAALLSRRERSAASWSTIAHHLLEAGAAGREGAVEACSRAAENAERQLAFADACHWYTRALTALGQDPTADLSRRGELLLRLADAELHSGAIADGKQTCQRAAELARLLANAELLAKAALMYGSVLVFAAVDAALVRLLGEALSRLPPDDAPLRAVLTARLAAALQPSTTPEHPIGMAREAVAMARRLGDSEVWLQTARYAVSAMMDLGRPSERLALNREYIQVAEQLGQRLELLRGHMRLVFDCFELGDLPGAEASIRAVENLAQALGHPFYMWRAFSFRAMAAIFQGRFADAEREMQRARELGKKARDPNVSRADVMQRYISLRLQGRHRELLDLRSELVAGCQGLEHADLITRLLTSEVWLLAGEPARAAPLLSRADTLSILSLADVSIMTPLIRWLEVKGDAEQWALTRATLEHKECRWATGGMTFMTWEEPVATLLGRCARQQGRLADAQALFQQAIDDSERAGGLPQAAWGRLDLAELLLEVAPQGREHERVRELLRHAAQTAERLGMPGLEESVRRALARVDPAIGEAGRDPQRPASDTPSPTPRLERDGEAWVLHGGEREVRLKDSRGVQWLHELLERPGQDVHVLDLVAPGRHDHGDSGELLDTEAINQYRRRLAEVSEELEEAEGWSDLGRSAALTEEHDFLQRELSRAVGLGGRERRAGAAAERARVNVQRRLRDALSRIAAQAPELGRELERAITTGVFCRYSP